MIETPKGSRNKYSYDPDCDCMELSTVLPEGMIFPYDFGFIPSTLGEDGDPLDILILMEAPVVPGCIVRTRVIGGIQAKQKEKGGSWTKNDRLIAVATHAQTYQKAKTLSDLRPHLIEEIIEFFADYNKLRNRKFKAGAVVGPRKAKELIKTGMISSGTTTIASDLPPEADIALTRGACPLCAQRIGSGTVVGNCQFSPVGCRHARRFRRGPVLAQYQAGQPWPCCW